MCLITKNNKAEITENDIYCFKIFRVSLRKGRLSIKTPYQNMTIRRDRKNDLIESSFESEVQDQIEFCESNLGWYEVNYGFHAYTHRETALYVIKWNEILVRCKIPKGSYVYRGLRNEICSNRIQINLTTCTRDIVSPILSATTKVGREFYKKYKHYSANRFA